MANRGAVCFHCGKPGHVKRYCLEIRCDICRKYGHIQRDCPERKCNICKKYGHIQYDCPERKCNICKKYGHIQCDCPEQKCNICNQYGHIQYSCPASGQTSGAGAPGPSCGRDRPDRGPPASWPDRGPPASNQPRGHPGMPARPCSEKSPTTTRPASTSNTASIVDSFFQHYPTVETESWLAYSRQASTTCYSPSRRKSSDLPSPSLPLMDKDMESNIRSVESVKRVAETILKMLQDVVGPIQILVDKQFSDFRENSPGLLSIPECESDLKRGDFDVIIIHPDYGYIHLEVKAFGDAQENMAEEEKEQEMVKVLRKKTVDRLHKGRQALTHLQPPGEPVNIVNTVAFPNVTRDLLRRALQKDVETRKKLTHAISPSGKPTVEALCLCSDDLPPKDGLVDESDPGIKKAIRAWWSLITSLGARNPELSPDAYRLVLASFFYNEDVKTLPQAVQAIGDRFEHLWLDERQAKVLQSEKQYMYIVGPPGSGKTLLLARKAVLWMREQLSVFVLYSRGNKNQSATEFLCHFMKMVSGSDKDVDLSVLREIQVSDFSQLEDILTEILRIKEDPTLGRAPRSLRHQPQDSASSEELSAPPHEQLLEKVFSPAVQIPQDSALSDELSVLHEQLEKVFSPAAQIPARETTADVTTTEKGEKICVIIDEINMRVIKEESKKLLKAIRKRFPAAKIWCAGQFPSHKPGKFFHMEKLSLPYRCTPKTQRLLQALELFCRNALQQPIFKYVPSSTCAPGDMALPFRHRLPGDGLDPVFFSHEGHGLGEIYECHVCARALTTYLKDTLKIGQKDASGKGLEESDVLIAVNSTALYKNMQALVYNPLYHQLTAANFPVNVYKVADPFQLDRPDICLMHTRMVAGMEKKVVVSIPCKQHQAKPDPARTYAEVVRGSPAASATATSALTAPSQTGPSPGSSLVPSQGHEEVPSLSQGLAQDHTRHHMREDSELPIRDILQQCPTLTKDQRNKLARLGHLNLHWLWYSISRSLAHNVVFHF